MTVETFTLFAYCAAIIAASLLGGWLPSLVRMTHTRTQLVLPHGLLELQHSPNSSGIDTLVWWTMMGMVVMLLLLRLFHFHQHDFGDHGHDHSHHEHCDDALHDVSGPHPLSWVGIALGLGLHTLIDGVALGAAVSGGESGVGFSWVGMGVFLAILLHKPQGEDPYAGFMELPDARGGGAAPPRGRARGARRSPLGRGPAG